jgi:hypothetical protein
VSHGYPARCALLEGSRSRDAESVKSLGFHGVFRFIAGEATRPPSVRTSRRTCINRQARCSGGCLTRRERERTQERNWSQKTKKIDREMCSAAGSELCGEQIEPVADI